MFYSLDPDQARQNVGKLLQGSPADDTSRQLIKANTVFELAVSTKSLMTCNLNLNSEPS